MKRDTVCGGCGNIFPIGELKINNEMWACPKCGSSMIEARVEGKNPPFKYDEVKVKYEDGEEN